MKLIPYVFIFTKIFMKAEYSARSVKKTLHSCNKLKCIRVPVYIHLFRSELYVGSMWVPKCAVIQGKYENCAILIACAA